MSAARDIQSGVREYNKYTTQTVKTVVSTLRAMMDIVPDIDGAREESLEKYKTYNQKLIKLQEISRDLEGLTRILIDKVQGNQEYLTEECMSLFERLNKAQYIHTLFKKDCKKLVISYHDLVCIRAMWRSLLSDPE